ncbi:hypothetical protein L1987_51569 [Smallanthus sonchifolius]|uniref:Uncharacterized protein n=1 Tax=Smallanthus sonchifolius TaxID=185202 RepID=A0ACB9EQR8_9ASTR|nr:hypothetical protein L1987_51569 [Smallanthus sonchifolius]
MTGDSAHRTEIAMNLLFLISHSKLTLPAIVVKAPPSIEVAGVTVLQIQYVHLETLAGGRREEGGGGGCCSCWDPNLMAMAMASAVLNRTTPVHPV